MTMLQGIFNRFLPTETETFVGCVCAFFGTIIHQFFGNNAAIEFLLTAMVIDYITGITAAYLYKRKHPKSHKGLDSRVGAIGILKKVLIFSVVAFAHIVDNAVSFDGIEAAVTWFYIGNEGLSIIENAAKSGVPMPKKILDVLEQLAGEQEKATRGNGAGSDGK